MSVVINPLTSGFPGSINTPVNVEFPSTQEITISAPDDSIAISDGTHTAAVTAASALKVDGSAVTQPVSGTVTANAGSGTFLVDGSAHTQPISASSLPLPTGAATAALQTQPGVDIGDVTINNASGGAAVNVQDGGNSLTVDGTIAATQSGTWNIGTVTTITDVVHVDDNGGSLTVDGPLTDAQLRASSVDVVQPAVTFSNSITSPTDWNIDCTNLASIRFQILGVFADAFISFNGTNNGTDYDSIQCVNDSIEANSLATFTDTTGTYHVNVAGLKYFQLSVGAISSGTIEIIAIGSKHITAPTGAMRIRTSLDEAIQLGSAVAAASLPVTIASDQTVSVSAVQSGPWSVSVNNASGGSAVNIQDGGNSISVDDGGAILSIDDGGGSLTIDGTVAISGTVPVSDASGSLTVDDGGASLTVDDGNTSLTVDDGGSSLTVDGTVVVSSITNAVAVTLASGPSAIGKAEDVASADADVGVPAMAVRKASPGNTSGTDGDYEMLQMSAGRLWASATIDAALPAGTNAIGKLTANDAIDIGDVTINNASGGSAVNIQDGGNSITVDGTVTASIAAAQTLATVTTVGTVTTITNVVHVDDNSSSLTVDNAGTFAVQATLQANSGVDIGKLTANQSVNVAQINGVTTTMGNGASGTGVQRVTLANDSTGIVALTTSSAQIGHLEANQSMNVAQMNGVTVTMGNGGAGTGVQRVTLASDSTGQVTLATGANTIGALTANQSINNAQVNGGTVVTSVTGVQDVMPRKRTSTTGLSPNYAANHITSKTTTTVTASTAYVSAIAIATSAAGTAWTMVIQNKEGTPKILVPSFTLTVPTTGLPVILQFAEPILMTTGIDIVTGGTTAGTVDVFVTYWQ